jgi:hypothetical protein
MKNITMTSPTQIARVRSTFPLVADRNLSAVVSGVRGGADVAVGFYAPKSIASDVAYFRSGRPPV